MPTKRNQNTVRRLGNSPQRGYVKVPNHLLRHGIGDEKDGKLGLTPDALLIFMLLLSHASGYETSAVEMNAQMGWGPNRSRTTAALRCLVDKNLLVIRDHVRERDDRVGRPGRVRQEYILKADCSPFTVAERAEWSAPIVLPPRGTDETCTPAVQGGVA